MFRFVLFIEHKDLSDLLPLSRKLNKASLTRNKHAIDLSKARG